MKGQPEVDHFIPWSLYPVDLGHNFVLAHRSCNGHKGDWLAALSHLERWQERNVVVGSELGEAFSSAHLPHDSGASVRIAAWAYERLEVVGGLGWLGGRSDLEPVGAAWRAVLGVAA